MSNHDDVHVERFETEGWEPQFRLDLNSATPRSFNETVAQFKAWATTQPQDKLPLKNGWYEVTPELAEKLLIRNAGNRKASLSVVKRYAREMQDRVWPRTGQSLIVNDNGRNVDGQHREWASLFGLVSFPSFLVAEGVSNDERLFMYIDGGKPRTVKDTLQTFGINGIAAVIGAAAQIECDFSNEAYAIEGKKPQRASDFPTRTRKEILEFIEDHDIIANVAGAIMTNENFKVAKTLVHHNDVSVFVAYEQMKRYDEDHMDEFWSSLSSPRADHPATEAIAQLHNLLTKNMEQAKKGKEKRFSKLTALAYLIRASNAYVVGESGFKVGFGIKEEFPTFAELPIATEVASEDTDPAFIGQSASQENDAALNA